jgi:hypothetical protein
MMNLSLLIIAGVLLVSTPMWAQADSGTLRKAEEVIQTWTGTLVDADCKAAVPSMACAITASTNRFGLHMADRKLAKLDNDGNVKVRAALESSGKMSGKVRASVSGSADGETINVDTIKIH